MEENSRSTKEKYKERTDEEGWYRTSLNANTGAASICSNFGMRRIIISWERENFLVLTEGAIIITE